MDRRKKRTSTNQYMMYIDLMEKDSIFATGRVPRDVDANYLQVKWKELSDKLNTCNSGPTLTAEEWRKRLNDWKNTTRCKYRRSLSGEKDISMTSLELKALELFGKAPNLSSSETLSIHLKSEKNEDDEVEHQRTSESLQKELQAAVEEAIGGDDDEEEMDEENEEHVLSDNPPMLSSSNNSGATAYRTIVVENTQYHDEHDDEQLEFIPHRRHNVSTSTASTNTAATAVQTVVTATPATNITKLINGDVSLKRLRTQAPEQIVYEVKKANVAQPHRNITIHSATTLAPQHQQAQQHHQQRDTSNSVLHQTGVITTQDAREIARQLKRLADIKCEKLKFEVARFKFRNPGFSYNSGTL